MFVSEITITLKTLKKMEKLFFDAEKKLFTLDVTKEEVTVENVTKYVKKYRMYYTWGASEVLKELMKKAGWVFKDQYQTKYDSDGVEKYDWVGQEIYIIENGKKIHSRV